MKTLNILGAGRVGRTLARLWRLQRVFEIGGVCNRTLSSAREAVAFIGAGVAVADVSAMPPAAVWLVATPDAHIALSAAALAADARLRAGDVVFHCSGALASDELRAARDAGAEVASIHPLKSFADAAAAARSFAGTYCVAEGSDAARDALLPAFAAIGARVSLIDAAAKPLYHAASVIVCNYLTALMEAGLQCYEQAGLPRATASAMMEPLVRETVDNVFALGTAGALTGPIARGDHGVVARQMAALEGFDARIAAVYRALGTIAVELARARGGATGEALAAVQRALQATAHPPT